MKKIKNILVASELNNDSYEALAYGITLGLMFNAKVSCIHVVKPSPIDILKENFGIGTARYGEALKKAKRDSEVLLLRLIDTVSMELGIKDLEVELKIVSGNLSESIVSYSEAIGADVIVICTSTGSKFSRTQYTNLALNMIKTEQANILLVPSGFKLERIERIGAYINFEGEDVGFIDKLIDLSSSTENGITLINVVERIKELDRSKQMKHTFEHSLRSDVKNGKINFALELGPVADSVKTLKSKHDIDLMIIRAYKLHWNNLKPATAFADEIIQKISTPLLVLKSNQKEKIKIK